MIMVTGANGSLASLTLQHLSKLDASAVGASRTPTHAQRHLDFDSPSGIELSGVTTLVLISAGYAEDDQVIRRHAAALDAAKRDGVRHVVYTSVVGAGDHLGFALAHRVTETLIQTSGMGWTILRNGLYAELFGGLLTWTKRGLQSPFGEGMLSAASRGDLAAAAATVANNPSAHAERIYDLVGEPITAREVADRLDVDLDQIDLGQYRGQLLSDPSLLAFQPPMLISIASSVRHGLLGSSSPELRRLIGRPLNSSLEIAADAAAASRPLMQ